jgi:hypothetical protein
MFEEAGKLPETEPSCDRTFVRAGCCREVRGSDGLIRESSWEAVTGPPRFSVSVV